MHILQGENLCVKLGVEQMYWRSSNAREEEMRVRRNDAEQWMSHRLLPENLRKRVRRYEHYTWQETRGVDEHSLLRNLPRDIQRYYKRHLCLALLMRVSILFLLFFLWFFLLFFVLFC